MQQDLWTLHVYESIDFTLRKLLFNGLCNLVKLSLYLIVLNNLSIFTRFRSSARAYPIETQTFYCHANVHLTIPIGSDSW